MGDHERAPADGRASDEFRSREARVQPGRRILSAEVAARGQESDKDERQVDEADAQV